MTRPDDDFEAESRRLRMLAIDVTTSAVQDVDWLTVKPDPDGAVFAPACELTTHGGALVAFVQISAQGGAVWIAQGDETHHLDDLSEAQQLGQIRRLVRQVAQRDDNR